MSEQQNDSGLTAGQTGAHGRVALVTGASRGIGAAIATRLAEDGYTVVGTATSPEGARVIADALGDGARGLEMRVDDDASVHAAFERLDAGPGMPLVIVNNAGVTRDNLLLRMKPEEWDSVVHTNLGALYRVIKPALRAMMKARWGRIVNISSVVARMGNPGQSNYVASKAGIEGFTRSLAQEVASRGITVNAVAPGYIQTAMTADLDEKTREALQGSIPLGRLGVPEDVAGLVAFLAGDAGSYITGQVIHVDGGMVMA